MIENRFQITTSIVALIALLKQQSKPIPVELQRIGDNPDKCTDLELVQALQVASLPCHGGTKQVALIKKMVGFTDDYKAIFTPHQTYIIDTSALDWKNMYSSISSNIENIQFFASSQPDDGKNRLIWDAFMNMVQSVSVCPKHDFGSNWSKILKILDVDNQDKPEASIRNLFMCYNQLQSLIKYLSHNKT